MKRTCVCLWAMPIVGWLLPTLEAGQLQGAKGATSSPGAAPASQTVLKFARSQDGISFTETGKVFLARAAAPDLVVLPGGDLLALFDYAAGDDPGRPTTLAVSRSNDHGRSWSMARSIRLGRTQGRVRGARHGDLVVMPDGSLRLFFAKPFRRAGTKPGGKGRDVTYIFSAVTRNGLDFRVDGATRIRVTGTSDAHTTCAWFRSRLHLFADRLGRSSAGSRSQQRGVEHLVSRDGRRFAPLRPQEIRGVDFVGSIVSLERGIRAYVSSATGIRSFISTNARDWKAEPGLRLAGGWDPAVVQLNDGSYLMLYCKMLVADPAELEPLVQTDPELAVGDDTPARDKALVWDDEAGNATDASAEGVASVDEADTHLDDASDSPHDSLDGDEPEVALAMPSDEDQDDASNVEWSSVPTESPAARDAGKGESVDNTSESEGVSQAADMDLKWEGEDAGNGLEDWDPAASDGFAPKPDFRTKVDCFAWYRDFALGHPEDNAYAAYTAFMPDPRDEPGSKPEWPEFANMLHDRDYDGPPGPWDPAEHPEWEASNQAVRGLLERYREASKHEGYAAPVETFGDATDSLPDGQELLLEMMLPSLAPHRSMIKATLADAWRMQNGKVSSERMLEAWKTALRASRHVSRGATLIEDLVSVAGRALVQKTARWALKHDVFSGDELETALETLRKYDLDDWDPVHSLRGEHGFAMDFTQYLFTPPTPDGKPRLNMERARAVMEANWTGAEAPPRFEQMSAEDAYATIEAFDNHYRELGEQMRIGYPDVRTEDLEATEEKHLHTSPVTETFLPSLSRYYKLRTRLETSRRATQLAYATHLFKARHGRWPDSLDELPADYGPDVRIDPFTGDDFGYRLTRDGPVIYSLSENGLDDGGVHSPRWDDELGNDAGSDDHVFWPPQPR